jgi:ADP-heptose:LPS heptosyltransferase
MLFCGRNRILVAGPWLSELGWELLVWQAAVRYRRITHRYEKVYVITFKNREVLYEGCETYAHDEKLINADFGIGKVSREAIDKLVRGCVKHFGITKPFDLFTPNQYLSFGLKLKRQFRNDLTFRKFYFPAADEKRFDIAFHFRAFERPGDEKPKSFPQQKADRLVRLCRAKNLAVCCIGAPGYSYVAEGAENRQSSNLATTISYICASRVVVGGSSAPMHLASLCGTPIVVWIGSPPGPDRYFTFGNPFRSEVFLVPEQSFNPSVEAIFESVMRALSCVNSDASVQRSYSL